MGAKGLESGVAMAPPLAACTHQHFMARAAGCRLAACVSSKLWLGLPLVLDRVLVGRRVAPVAARCVEKIGRAHV